MAEIGNIIHVHTVHTRVHPPAHTMHAHKLHSHLPRGILKLTTTLGSKMLPARGGEAGL